MGKPKCRRYEKDNMTEAIYAAEAGMAIRKAARQYGVPESTLRMRLRHPLGPDVKLGGPTAFSQEQEEMLAEHCIKMAQAGHAYHRWQVIEMAHIMAKAMGRSKAPSDRWFYGFLKRFPNLKIFMHKKKGDKTQDTAVPDTDQLLKSISSIKKECDMPVCSMATQAEHRTVYPKIEPYDTGYLKVSDLHTLYYEQSGNKDGNPVVYLHGGPGGGTSPDDRRFFDPEAYRIILFDQRGSGKSIPAAELKENTTWHSVEDIEKLRKHLGIDKWVVFGGSWGSTLSLAYAETHPDKVKALILRGIFNLRRSELEWFYEGKGAHMLFPDYWEDYIDFIPEVERGAIMDAYYRRLTSENGEVRNEAAKHWSRWEMACSHLYITEEKINKPEKDIVWALQFSRIECHFFVNGGFMKSPTQLLDNVDKIRHIPGTIVQGRYDIVCPMDTAWQLHKRWPEAEFYIAPDSGHNSREPSTLTKLLDATDKYKNL